MELEKRICFSLPPSIARTIAAESKSYLDVICEGLEKSLALQDDSSLRRYFQHLKTYFLFYFSVSSEYQNRIIRVLFALLQTNLFDSERLSKCLQIMSYVLL